MQRPSCATKRGRREDQRVRIMRNRLKQCSGPNRQTTGASARRHPTDSGRTRVSPRARICDKRPSIRYGKQPLCKRGRLRQGVSRTRIGDNHSLNTEKRLPLRLPAVLDNSRRKEQTEAARKRQGGQRMSRQLRLSLITPSSSTTKPLKARSIVLSVVASIL